MENEARKDTTSKMMQWAESGQPRVTRDALEAAGGQELDELVAHVGLLRLRPSPATPEPEGDLPLRNRALAYAEEWGLLEEAA